MEVFAHLFHQNGVFAHFALSALSTEGFTVKPNSRWSE